MFRAEEYQSYVRFFESPHEESFMLEEGTGPVIISAPHSVEQLRLGRPKYAEPQSGACARMLHSELGCPVIYKTRNCGDDANFDADSDYKRALADYIRGHDIRFVLDLHQLAWERDVIVNIGTAGLRNIRDQKPMNIALAAFSSRRVGLIQIDTPYDGSGPNTIASFTARECGVESLQIELNSDAVRFGFERSAVGDICEALGEIVRALTALRGQQ